MRTTDLAAEGSTRGSDASRETVLPKPALARLAQKSIMQEAAAIQLTDDRVLIRRIEEPSNIALTDRPKSIKGLVLAVGPGKWVPGTWWYHAFDPLDGFIPEGGEWVWYDGYRERMEVKPGMIVAFNSRWNDLSHAENKGTGADGKGALERPLSYKLDPMTHLVREADIFGILPDENVRVEYLGTAIEKTYFKNGQVSPGDPSNAIVKSTGMRF